MALHHLVFLVLAVCLQANSPSAEILSSNSLPVSRVTQGQDLVLTLTKLLSNNQYPMECNRLRAAPLTITLQTIPAHPVQHPITMLVCHRECRQCTSSPIPHTCMHLANSTKWAIQHMVCKLLHMGPMAPADNSDTLPRDLVGLSLDMAHIRVEDLVMAPPVTMTSVDKVAVGVGT